MCKAGCNKKHTPSEVKLTCVVRDAELAFWREVAKQYPMATLGDLDPLSSVYLSTTMRDAIKQWVELNVPKYSDIPNRG